LRLAVFGSRLVKTCSVIVCAALLLDAYVNVLGRYRQSELAGNPLHPKLTTPLSPKYGVSVILVLATAPCGALIEVFNTEIPRSPVTVTLFEVDVLKLLPPTYTALNTGAVKAVFVETNVATPEAFSEAIPSDVVPAINTTTPVGLLALDFTVAVSV